MVLLACGVNYKTAPLFVREKLAANLPLRKEVVQRISLAPTIQEVALVTTCNRTELYCDAFNSHSAFQWFLKQCELRPSEVEPYCYQYVDDEMVKHVMRVASGLDSMVLGEVEILGQLKTAYSVANEAKTLGKQLDRLFQTTFSVAKAVRSKTAIGVNPVSVAFAARRLAEHIFSDLARATVLLIGAGDLIQLMAKHLVASGIESILIANRTESNAKSLARQIGGKALKLEAIPNVLHTADIVITGTNSILPILGKGMVERAIKTRKRKPMFMIDLAVPRNIEPEVSGLPDVYLYCIDDLEGMVTENRDKRLSAAKDAEKLIEVGAREFMDWVAAQSSLSTLRSFRRKYETIRTRALNEALLKLKLGKSPEEVCQHLSVALTNRILHEPTIKLREAGFSQDETILQMMKELYELDPPL